MSTGGGHVGASPAIGVGISAGVSVVSPSHC